MRDFSVKYTKYILHLLQVLDFLFPVVYNHLLEGEVVILAPHRQINDLLPMRMRSDREEHRDRCRCACLPPLCRRQT